MSAIKEAYDKLVSEKETLLLKLQPFQDAKDKTAKSLNEAQAAHNKTCKAYEEVNKNRLYDLSVEIAALARMLPNHVKAP